MSKDLIVRINRTYNRISIGENDTFNCYVDNNIFIKTNWFVKIIINLISKYYTNKVKNYNLKRVKAKEQWELLSPFRGFKESRLSK